MNYLNFNVSNFGAGADDWPANQRWEDVFGEVGACIAALDKLEEKTEKHAFQYSKQDIMVKVQYMFSECGNHQSAHDTAGPLSLTSTPQ